MHIVQTQDIAICTVHMLHSAAGKTPFSLSLLVEIGFGSAELRPMLVAPHAGINSAKPNPNFNKQA